MACTLSNSLCFMDGNPDQSCPMGENWATSVAMDEDNRPCCHEDGSWVQIDLDDLDDLPVPSGPEDGPGPLPPF